MGEVISPEAYKKGFQHSSVMAICTVAKAIMGFIPPVLIARTIGLGNITDAYLMALSINQIIMKFTRIGTLPKAFIIALSDDFVNEKRKSESVFNNFFNISILVSIIIAVFVYISAPTIVNIIAKGFDGYKKDLTIDIVRIMAPLFIYQVIVSLFESIFKLFNEFSRWAILEVISPFSVLIFVYYYLPKIGIYSIVYGTLVGAFLHLSLAIYYTYFKFNYAYNLGFDFKHKAVKKIPATLYPFYLSGVFVQIMFGVHSFLVSLLPAGFASAYFYALRVKNYIEDFSISIFSEITFPYLLKKIAQRSIEQMEDIHRKLIYFANYIYLPLLILLAVFGGPLVSILFANKFTDPAVISKLSIAFSCFIFFFMPEPSNNMLTNTIMAKNEIMWVNLVNISRMIISIVLSLLLFRYFRFWGVVFSWSLTYLQGLIMNQLFLKKKYAFENIFLSANMRKIAFLNTLLLLFCLLVNYLISYGFHAVYVYQKIILTVSACFLGIIFYAAGSFLLKNEEFSILLSLARGRR